MIRFLASVFLIISIGVISDYFLQEGVNASRKKKELISFEKISSPDFAGEEVPLEKPHVKSKYEIQINKKKNKNDLKEIIKKAEKWFPVIESILEEKNVPDDFKFLAVCESELENKLSKEGPAGFWQFEKETAQSLGLVINENLDERYNVEKSTMAACEYFNSAYKEFGSWTLAASAFNLGIHGLKKQLKNQNETNYYDLSLKGPAGTYLYKIIALKYYISEFMSETGQEATFDNKELNIDSETRGEKN